MNPYELKLARINKSLEETNTFLHQYERMLMITIDPLESQKIKDTLAFYKQREEELLNDWEQATQRMEQFNLKQGSIGSGHRGY